MSGKKQKPDFYLQQAGGKLLNMIFHRCSYKISCFSELAYSSSVLVLIFSTIASIVTNKTSFSQESWDESNKMMKSQKKKFTLGSGV